MSKVKLNKNNQYNFNLSFNKDDLEFVESWGAYCKENHFSRTNPIKRLMKQELKEKRLVIK